MVTAREIMHVDVQAIRPSDTLASAAATMRDLHVGSLPVVGQGGELQGIITDRDIVVRCVAERLDPAKTTAQELVHTAPISVQAGSSVKDVLSTMEEHQIRRIPVIENDRLVGIISEANIATSLGKNEVLAFTSAVYSAPPNN
jgi:CBS domain-containing protein